ncbi:MAG: hypothetical protein KatS3mg121_1434 [Gammaproteobacteria bacterium]|nr:MAG: hypothetical protein KatS3mg121_1434 [Gammaproteobacteria bacterium]
MDVSAAPLLDLSTAGGRPEPAVAALLAPVFAALLERASAPLLDGAAGAPAGPEVVSPAGGRVLPPAGNGLPRAAAVQAVAAQRFGAAIGGDVVSGASAPAMPPFADVADARPAAAAPADERVPAALPSAASAAAAQVPSFAMAGGPNPRPEGAAKDLSPASPFPAAGGMPAETVPDAWPNGVPPAVRRADTPPQGGTPTPDIGPSAAERAAGSQPPTPAGGDPSRVFPAIEDASFFEAAARADRAHDAGETPTAGAARAGVAAPPAASPAAAVVAAAGPVADETAAGARGDVRVGAAGHGHEPQDAFVKQVQWLAQAGGRQHAQLRLDPPALGTVDVGVHTDGDRVQIHLVVADAAARDGLEAGLTRLRDVLAGQGLQLVSVQFEQRGAGDQQAYAHGGTPAADPSEAFRSDDESGPAPACGAPRRGLLDVYA